MKMTEYSTINLIRYCPGLILSFFVVLKNTYLFVKFIFIIKDVLLFMWIISILKFCAILCLWFYFNFNFL